MRKLTLAILLTLSPWSFAIGQNQVQLDPDLVDPEMTQVMYVISPNDIKVATYRNGAPASLDLKLCDNCQIKRYRLADNAELLINERPLLLTELTLELIKKQFDAIQLGIDRSKQTISYLYLGGLSESSAEEYAQEQSDEN